MSLLVLLNTILPLFKLHNLQIWQIINSLNFMNFVQQHIGLIKFWYNILSLGVISGFLINNIGMSSLGLLLPSLLLLWKEYPMFLVNSFPPCIKASLLTYGATWTLFRNRFSYKSREIVIIISCCCLTFRFTLFEKWSSQWFAIVLVL